MREMMPTSADENQPNEPIIPTGAIVLDLCKWKNKIEINNIKNLIHEQQKVDQSMWFK